MARPGRRAKKGRRPRPPGRPSRAEPPKRPEQPARPERGRSPWRVFGVLCALLAGIALVRMGPAGPRPVFRGDFAY